MSMRDWSATGLLVLTISFMFATPATAHTRSQSFSAWSLRDGQVRLSFSVQSLEATRLGLIEGSGFTLDGLLVKHLASHLTVRAGAEPCRTVTGPQARAARAGYLRVEWRFTCPTDEAIEISNNAFFDVAPSHVHYARVRTGDRRPVEYLFTSTERRRVIAADGSAKAEFRGASFVAYVLLGIEHILIGIDHLAFLLALLLLCRHVREVVFMITGFTMGHSITLSLAALGIVKPNVPVIEALIGFTIALVAAENVAVTTATSTQVAVIASVALVVLAQLQIFAQVGLPAITLVGLAIFTICYLPLAHTQERAVRLRPMLTVLFGLVHGCGFASVLLEVGLPTDRMVAALLGFNAGVEIGQLGIVIVLWNIGRVIVRRFPRADYRLAIDAASATLCGLGLFWFTERAFVA
jgi:hypothetical protein